MRKVLILVVLLAGCAVPPANPVRQGTATPVQVEDRPLAKTAAAATPAPSETAQPEKEGEPAERPLIVYHRSGGIAGSEEEWKIYASGRVSHADLAKHDNPIQEWQVEPEQVAELLHKIETLGFFDLEDDYMPLDTCCDRFTHEVTVRRGGNVKSLRVLDATPEVPVVAWDTIDAIQGFLEEGKE
jgi:hypothetical protein